MTAVLVFMLSWSVVGLVCWVLTWAQRLLDRDIEWLDDPRNCPARLSGEDDEPRTP